MSLRAGLFLAAMFAVLGGLGSLFGLVGAAVALSAATVISFWSFWSAAPNLIARTHAIPVIDAGILRMVDDMAAAAGISSPGVYEIDESQPNALVIGGGEGTSTIILTSGLRSHLTDDELRAVIAHELAHIRNRDILTCTLAATLISAIIALALTLAIVVSGLSRQKGSSNTVVLLAVIAPVIAFILKFAMVRSIEYRADRDAAFLCGGPSDLISALCKLDRLSHQIKNGVALMHPRFASLSIVNPLPESWVSLFSAHPPIARRVARLEAMMEKTG